MKKQSLTPQVGVTYYQKRGIHAWDVIFNNNPKLKEAALRDYRACGLYQSVDFYPVGRTLVLLKMVLNEMGVSYYQGNDVGYDKVHTGYFQSEWSDQPEK